MFSLFIQQSSNPLLDVHYIKKTFHNILTEPPRDDVGISRMLTIIHKNIVPFFLFLHDLVESLIDLRNLALEKRKRFDQLP